MPAPHTHSLDVTVAGTSRFRQRDPKRDGLGALAALLVAALIAGTDDRAPLFVMTPEQIAFPPSNVGAPSAGLPLTLQNRGAAAIALDRLIPSQAGLVVVQSVDCPGGRVPPGQRCVVNVAVTPSAAGPLNAVLALDGGKPSVQLTGTGISVPAVVRIPDRPVPPIRGAGPNRGTAEGKTPPGRAADGAKPPPPPPPPPPPVKPPLIAAARFTQRTFPTQAEVDTAKGLRVVLQNTGQTTIATAGFRFEGGHAGDFTLSRSSCALGDPQKECPIDVTFTPREAGEHRAVLIAEAAGTELDRTALVGTASAPLRPHAEPRPASLQFSKRGERKYVLIYNSGTAPLRFGPLAVDNQNDFSIDSKACTGPPNQAVLEAEKSCLIFVTYNGKTPTSSRLTVAHNDPSSPTVISLSSAGEPVEVPNLSGNDRDDALRKLADKKLVAGTIGEEPRCKDIGKVVAQSPDAKTRVAQGTAVDFTLSSMGRDPAEVPGVRGQPRAFAERAITGARLRVAGTTTSETDSIAAGSAVETRPKAGTKLAPGCDVTLVVAVPMPKFPVPGVVGQTFAAAKQLLPSGFGGAFANFHLGNVQGGPVPKGEENLWTVTAQSPQAGEMLPRGTAVDITVTRQGNEIFTKPDPRAKGPAGRVQQPVVVN